MKTDKSILICESMLDGAILGVNTVDHMELTESLQYDTLIESCDELCRVLVESTDTKKKFDWRKILSSIRQMFRSLLDKILRKKNVDKKTLNESDSLLSKILKAIGLKKKELKKSDLPAEEIKVAEVEMEKVVADITKAKTSISNRHDMANEIISNSMKNIAEHEKKTAEISKETDDMIDEMEITLASLLKG